MKSTRCYLSRNQISALFGAEDTSAEPWLGVNCCRGARGALFAAVLMLFMCTGLATGAVPPASFQSASLLQFGTSSCAAASLASGDFNGDGRLDLIVIGNACTATADIFIGNGDGTFSLSQAISPLTGSQGAHDPHVVAVADFNGDGHLDFAVALQGSNFGSLDVYLGDGTGHFTFSASYSYGSRNGGIGSIAIADVNGDGKLDLVVGNGFEDGTITVMFGNGDGTFSPQTPFVCCQNNPGYDVMDVAIADFNNDGHPDIAVADEQGGIDILLNQGDGTFQAPIFYSEPGGGAFPDNESGIAAADLNHDGKQDVVLTWNGGFWVYLGNGDGTFNTPVNYSTPCGAYGCYGGSVAIADINGDNKLDVIMSDLFASTVWAFLGNGDGTFQPGTGYATDFFPQSIVIADFNGDGNPDFAVGNDTDDQVTIALGNGDGTFQAGRNYDPISYASSGVGEVSADFNNDGYLDVATWGSDGHNDFIRVMLNNSHGVLGTPIITTVFGCCTQSISDIAAGDVNGDGKIDLVGVINETNPQVAVFLGNGDGTFQAPVFYSTGSSQVPEVVVLAYLRNNGNLDTLVSNSDGSLSVLLNAGNGTFGAATVIQGASGSGAGDIASGDFNGDGKLDLALEDYGDSSINILLGKGDGSFQSPNKVPVATAPQGIAVGDFNGDGKLDLATVGGNIGDDLFAGGGLAILLGNGDGTFAPATYYSFYPWVCCSYGAYPNPNFVSVADVNLDGIPDLLVAYAQTTSIGSQCCYPTNNIGIGVFLGNGDGTFEFENPLGQPGIAGGPFLVGTGSSGLVFGDFNGDGAADAAVLNSSGASYSARSYVTMLLNTTSRSGVCTSTSLASSANPASYGQAVMLAATVMACEGAPPTGPITFFDGGIQIGTATLAGGHATLTTSTLGVGSHAITAIFGGNGSFKPSASPVYSQVVNTSTTTYTLTVADLGTGSGSVTDDSSPTPLISCADTAGVQSGTCSATYNMGTTVNLTATPVSPATFGGWGGACTGTGGCSVLMNSAQSVTASFVPSPPAAAVAFNCPGGVYPCSNVTGPPAVFNCPSATNPCTDPNAHSLTLTATQVNMPFTLTVEANEVPTSQANGDCPSGQGPSTDFDCRFTSFFAYETLPNGDTIVPACDAYSNGNCVFYSIYFGSNGNEPPAGDFNGPIAWSIAWNNTSYPPPSGYPYQVNNPRLFYDPDYEVSATTPYGTDCSVPMDINGSPTSPRIYCQFVFDITTYYDPTQPPDAGIGGKSKQFSDVVVAFPLTIAAPNLSVTKTADQTEVTAGSPIGYTITMSNSSAPGTGSATNAMLSDPLPAGSGVNWSISPAYSGQGTCTISGAPPTQTLSCALGNLSPAIGSSVHVSSSSSSAGTYNNTATFSAANNAPQTSSATIQVAPASEGGVAFTPTSIDFGNVYLGSAKVKKQVTMKNTGASSLTIGSISLTLALAANPAEFSLKNYCPSKLAAGKSCAVALFLSPNAVGTPSAFLNVADNAPGSPQQVGISVSVINPQATFNATTLRFGRVQVGDSSTQSVTLTSTGTTTLNAAIGVTGTDRSDFKESSDCPSSLAPGDDCKISVTFTPSATGSRTAKLTVTSNAQAGKQSLALTGYGSQ